MVCLQVDELNDLFAKLKELKKNNWIIKTKPKTKITTNTTTNNNKQQQTKTTLNSTVTTPSPAASSASAEKARIRAEASKNRLLEAKKRAALLKLNEVSSKNNSNSNDTLTII
jgi:hypothetical protein